MAYIYKKICKNRCGFVYLLYFGHSCAGKCWKKCHFMHFMAHLWVGHKPLECTIRVGHLLSVCVFVCGNIFEWNIMSNWEIYQWKYRNIYGKGFWMISGEKWANYYWHWNQPSYYAPESNEKKNITKGSGLVSKSVGIGRNYLHLNHFYEFGSCNDYFFYLLRYRLWFHWKKLVKVEKAYRLIHLVYSSYFLEDCWTFGGVLNLWRDVESSN